MTHSPLSPDTWSQAVNLNSVQLFPAEDGFAGRDGRLWRPAGIAMPDMFGEPKVMVVSESGEFDTMPFDHIPRMGSFMDVDSSNPPGVYMATLHHRKGAADRREDRLRILGITNTAEYPSLPPTEFRYGKHPDHPGEHGFYIGALHVGWVSLNHSDIEYLPTDEVNYKYFPVPRTRED